MQTKQMKRAAAEHRATVWRGMTPEQQLAHFDKHGFAAKRQRARIARVMEAKKLGGAQSLHSGEVSPPKVPRPKFKKGRKQ